MREAKVKPGLVFTPAERDSEVCQFVWNVITSSIISVIKADKISTLLTISSEEWVFSVSDLFATSRRS